GDGFASRVTSFLEDGAVVLGPSSGELAGEPVRVPISYDGNAVAELGVVAADLAGEDRALLDRIAELLAPYCLVGWDTGGEAWSPYDLSRAWHRTCLRVGARA